MIALYVVERPVDYCISLTLRSERSREPMLQTGNVRIQNGIRLINEPGEWRIAIEYTPTSKPGDQRALAVSRRFHLMRSKRPKNG